MFDTERFIEDCRVGLGDQTRTPRYERLSRERSVNPARCSTRWVSPNFPVFRRFTDPIP